MLAAGAVWYSFFSTLSGLSTLTGRSRDDLSGCEAADSVKFRYKILNELPHP